MTEIDDGDTVEVPIVDDGSVCGSGYPPGRSCTVLKVTHSGGQHYTHEIGQPGTGIKRKNRGQSRARGDNVVEISDGLQAGIL